ncbi:hypothetical protein QGM71_01745 [Virgibacillus sp. C22-A2]|uniref:Uncharacterized protein n=1 Tax=Virgibacillus tibetensis TaxID=3042313 RepID=A0ABU6KAR6_9BACI|nr:hypothetical protein [Virgibacillus sp. C22-A2]
MQGLFDAIFSNFFIVIIIIAGIIGFLRDNTAKQQQQQKQQQERKPVNRPNPTNTPSEGYSRSQQGRSRDSKPQRTYSTSTIEEQQREQMERLADQYNSSTEIKQGMDKLSSNAITDDNSLEPINELSTKQKKLKRQIGKNLNKNGLVNGIIMAEVLGSPRALKPYRSVITNRRK